MKPTPTLMRLLFALACFIPLTVVGQTASNLCEEEMLSAWNQVDIGRLLQSPDITRMEFVYSYLHVENKEPVVQRVQAAAGRGQSRYMGSEEWVLSDANSTFTWFPYRFVIYRTTPRPQDRILIKEINADIFSKGIATVCEYIPYAGNDTLAWKRILFSPHYEEKQRSGIRSIEFVLNPWDKSLAHIRIEFEPGQLLHWADYAFSYISKSSGEETPFAAPEEVMLDESGNVRAEFKGAKLFDYRKK